MKKHFLVFALLYISVQSFGQTKNYSNIIPPSPDAAALGKYGQYPVSLHTGVPEIAIPITELGSKELSLPINLSYHASGNLVSELASWVGLGWSLNAGGVITRTVRGRPDDDNFGFYNRTPIHSSNIAYTSAMWEELNFISRGNFDTESDYYFYNFAGNSGAFIFDDSKQIVKIPFSAVKIDKSLYPNEFKIVDIEGNIYRFAEKEITASGSCGFDGCIDDFSYTSSWYISQIISSDKSDTITFSYTTDSEITTYSYPESQTIGDKYDLSGMRHYKVIDPVTTAQLYRKMSQKRLEKIVSKKGKIVFKTASRTDLPKTRLSKIEVYSDTTGYHNYKLRKVYKLNNNLYFGSGLYSARLKLSTFEEYSSDSTSMIKRHQFFYDELYPPTTIASTAVDLWGYYNGYTTNTSLIPPTIVTHEGWQVTLGSANREVRAQYAQSCILKKVVFPTGGSTEFTYEANMYDEIAEADNTATATAAQYGNTTSLLTQTVNFTPNNSGWAKLTVTCSDITDAIPFFSTVSLYEKVTGRSVIYHVYDPYNYSPFIPRHIKTYDVYLTNGIEYELKSQAKGHSTSTDYGGAAFAIGSIVWKQKITGTYKTAGGLRIKEIKTFSSPTSLPINRTYKYGENENGAGKLLVSPSYLNLFTDTRSHSVGVSGPGMLCGIFETERLTIYGNTINELSTMQGSPVVYGTITEYLGTPTTNNGKIVHTFDIALDEIQSVQKAYKNGVFQTNASWKGGDELRASYYKSDGVSLVRKEENGFTIGNNSPALGFIAGYKRIHSGCFVIDGGSLNSWFYWFDYNIYSGVKRISTEKQIEFSTEVSTLQTEVQKTYYYDNPLHWLANREITVNSNNDSIIQRTYYPQDYNTTAGNVSTLISKNIIGKPVLSEKIVNKKLTGGTAIKYNDDGMPIEVYGYEASSPISAPALDKTVIVPPNYYKRQVKLEYDATTKNLKNVYKEKDAPVAFIWGYNGSLPIAKIENATDSIVESVLGAGYKTNLISLSTYQTNALRSNIQNAFVNTYTYDPLFGPTSATDPNGVKVTYNYDNFRRLSSVIDNSNNLRKAYNYNYKPPAQLTASPSQLTFTSSALGGTVNITSNVNWTVSDDQSWITPSVTSGSGSTTITVNVTANSLSSSRSGTVTISDNSGSGLPSQQIAVVQQGNVPNLQVSTTELLIPGVSTQTFTITSNISWVINITYYVGGTGWLNATPLSGSGNATITVTSSSAGPPSGQPPWEAEIQVSGSGIYRIIDCVKYY